MQLEQNIPASVLVRVYLLGPLEIWKRDPTGTWEFVAKEAWKKCRPARSVFKRLLVQPGRRLSRGSIEDDLWSETDNFELATKNVYNAISLIRGIIGNSLVKCWEATYEIAGQTLIWTDIHACEALLKEAENQGQKSTQALLFLEQVLTLLERGELLEAEDGQWCYAFRKRAEDMLSQTRLWLAESYEGQGKLWQAGEQYRAMILTDPSNEEALQRWLEMLVRYGKRQEALKCYRDMKGFVESQGFTLSNTLEQMVASLNEQPTLAPLKTLTLQIGESLSLSPIHTFQGIALPKNIAEKHGMDFSLLPRIFLDFEVLARLERAFAPRIRIDLSILDHLQLVTFELKKQLVQGEGTNWFALLTAVSNQLRFLINLLESHSGRDQRLTTLIGETCLLIGDVLFNMRDYQAATRYYEMALRAAQEASNMVLLAVVSGRYSLLLIDSHQYCQAQQLMEKALRSANPCASSIICSWLWAAKAEVYANEGEEKPCLEALDAAKEQLGRQEERMDCYTFVAELAPLVYGAAKLLGYEGTCYLRLKRPAQAQHVLVASQKSSSHPHHQSLVNADFALALTQQDAPREACIFVTKALTSVQQTGSARAFQRILSARQALHPWDGFLEVRELDERIFLFTKEGV
jgi:DNA-binding SARP family transcriptional activator